MTRLKKLRIGEYFAILLTVFLFAILSLYISTVSVSAKTSVPVGSGTLAQGMNNTYDLKNTDLMQGLKDAQWDLSQATAFGNNISVKNIVKKEYDYHKDESDNGKGNFKGKGDSNAWGDYFASGVVVKNLSAGEHTYSSGNVLSVRSKGVLDYYDGDTKKTADAIIKIKINKIAYKTADASSKGTEYMSTNDVCIAQLSYPEKNSASGSKGSYAMVWASAYPYYGDGYISAAASYGKDKGGQMGVDATITITLVESGTNTAISASKIPTLFWEFSDIDVKDQYSRSSIPIITDPYVESIDFKSGFAAEYVSSNTQLANSGTKYCNRVNHITTENESWTQNAVFGRIATSGSATGTVHWTGSGCMTVMSSLQKSSPVKWSISKAVSATGESGTYGDNAYLSKPGAWTYYRITVTIEKWDSDINGANPFSSNLVVKDHLDCLHALGSVECQTPAGLNADGWTNPGTQEAGTRYLSWTYTKDKLNALDGSKENRLRIYFRVKTRTYADSQNQASKTGSSEEDLPSGKGSYSYDYLKRAKSSAPGKSYYRQLQNRAHGYLQGEQSITGYVYPWVPLGVKIRINKVANDNYGLFGDNNLPVTKTGAIYTIYQGSSALKRHDMYYFKTNASDDSIPARFNGTKTWHSEDDPEGSVIVGKGGDDDGIFVPGTYTINEVQAPNQFYNSPSSTTSQSITITDDDIEKGTKTVTFSNPRPVGKIHIQKLIPDSGCTKQIKNYAGNTFAIYAAADIINPRDGSAKYSKDHLMTTITTDSSGDAYTGYLPMGSYYAVETGVAKGLLRNRTTITGLNLSVGDWVDNVADVGESKATHTNYPTLTRFRKTNELTNTEVTTKGLAGATLEVKDNGQVVASGQTDASGIFTVSGLDINHTYTVHEAIPAPHYTAAPDQQFTTTTQTETDGTQIVGINTQWYDNWCDYGYGYTTPQATGTRIIDVPEYLTLRLYKRIDASDPWISNEQSSYGHGEPTFLFRISGTDFRGQKVTYYRTFTFTKSEIDNAKHTGWLVHKRDVKVRAGTYTVTEVKSMRYKVTDVFKHTNATVNSDNQSADVDLHMSNNNTLAEVGFTNRTTNYNDWSHTSTSVNAFKNSYVNSDSTHKPVADEADETEDKVAS